MCGLTERFAAVDTPVSAGGVQSRGLPYVCQESRLLVVLQLSTPPRQGGLFHS